MSARARARLRRRDGHDAVRQGRLHQQELRRAEPDAAGSRRRGAPGIRPRRRRRHRDQHVRRQPHQARIVRPGRQAARRSTCRARGSRARAARRSAPTSPARSGRSASASSRGARPASTRRATTSASRRRRSLEGGVDLFILETFRDLNEIGAAIDAVRRVSDLPIVAQMTTEEDGNTLDGTPPERFAPELERRGATIIGVNCAVGPGADARDDRADGGGDARCSCRRSPTPASRATSKGATSISARRSTWRRTRAASSCTTSALVGGCCGTTPEHIRQIKAAVRAARPLSARTPPAAAAAADKARTARGGDRAAPPVRARAEVAARAARWRAARS